MVRQLFNEFRGFFAKNGKDFASILIRWGFISGNDAVELSQYLIAFVKGGLSNVLQLREQKEKEHE